MARTQRALIVALLAAVGCGRQINPEWCRQPGHDDPACVALVDGGGGSVNACVTDDDCSETAQALGVAAACLPDGTCTGADSVLFASPGGTGDACTSNARCQLTTALAKVSDTRKVIVLSPGEAYAGSITISRSLRIVGNAATLRAARSGAAITITNNATLEIDHAMITGSVDASGISCVSGALIAHAIRVSDNAYGIDSACALTLDGSVISSNSDGALTATSGAIDVRNNFIVNNGTLDTGGRLANVLLGAQATGRFAFNTVAYNEQKKKVDLGVTCLSSAMATPGNVVTDNTFNKRKGTAGVNPQVTGSCDFSLSYTVAGAGENDMNWVDVATSDFHLTASSTVLIDPPGLPCDIATDFDGSPRPANGCDYGADELGP